MATAAKAKSVRRRSRLAPDRVEYVLAGLALILLAMAAAALVRGQSHWGALPVFVWAHIATVLVALALTPVMMMRRRGDRLHRRLGYVWAGAILLTALSSFGIRGINDGGLSFIHLLSVFTLVQLPRIILAARRHDISGHRDGVRWLTIGGLLIAGYFTFPGDRMLGNWLFQ